jgi:hypothetical protein
MAAEVGLYPHNSLIVGRCEEFKANPPRAGRGLLATAEETDRKGVVGHWKVLTGVEAACVKLFPSTSSD